MREKEELLEVVDENDVVIGLESRSRIHREGLLHREANILFITPDGQLIFQQRSSEKETYPNKLICAVGGHVEPGMTYEQTARKECAEETGLIVSPSDLVFLGTLRKRSFDQSTRLTNNVFRAYFAYLFSGSVSDLRPEPGSGQGFMSWPIEELEHLSPVARERFAGNPFTPEYMAQYRQARAALGLADPEKETV